MGHGIDYGMGKTNVDHATGIRYGVIPLNDVCQAWCDSSEPDYGDPHCPTCGGDVEEGSMGRYWCDSCDSSSDSEECYPEESNGSTLDDGEYQASSDNEGHIFITRAPYFTRAAYCSPCAPGACHLRNPCDDGDRAYCFGHEFFEDGKAPYPVYSVETGTLVEPKEQAS